MACCEYCHEEIKIDEWREHIISQKHLQLEQKNFCKVCNMKYDNPSSAPDRAKLGRGNTHIHSDLHKKSPERLDLYSI